MRKNIWLSHLFLPVDNNAFSRTAILARNLADMGHDITLFHSSFDHFTKARHKVSLPVEKTKTGGSVTFVQMDCTPYKKNVSIQRFFNHYTCSRDLKKKIRTMPIPDAIVSSYPDPYTSDVLSRYAEENNVPFALDVRDQWPDIFLDYVSGIKASIIRQFVTFEKKRLHKVLRRSRKAFTMSLDFKSWLQTMNSDLNVEVIYLATRNLVTENHRARAISDDTPVVYAFIGSFNVIQNPVRILDAFRKFKDSSGEARNAKLLIGGKGEQLTDVEHCAAVNNDVDYIGWLQPEQMDKILGDVHVGLLTVEFKALVFNNKSFTYLSNSVPIISAAYGELRDYLNEHNSGWDIEPGSTESLKNAFEQSYNDIRNGYDYSSNAGNLYLTSFERDTNYKAYANSIIEMTT